MIRVVRPANPPAILQTRGLAERQTLCGQFDAAPDAYKSGAKKFTFKSAIYAHQSVKRTLCKAQHGKCAFCESKVTAVSYGDVEHFRPKAGYQQRSQDTVSRLGYYWLAYEWTNLLLACQLCNQQGKRNLFPLANAGQRAISHHDDLAREEAMLIDPAAVDPEEAIGFRDEVAYPKRRSKAGKTTIDALRLNRPELLESRRDLVVKLRIFADVRGLLRRMIAEAGSLPPADMVSQLRQIDAHLAACQRDDAQFAAMARAALTQ